MQIKKRFGLRLKALRKAAGLTQMDLAEAIDRSEDSISQMERGISWPGPETLEVLATALKIHSGAFFDEPKEARSKASRLQALTDANILLRRLPDRDLARAVEVLRAMAD
jgi:transcriptional regulator with XRE-family HTH domain